MFKSAVSLRADGLSAIANFVSPQRRIFALALGLSIAATGLSLLQPLLVNRVISNAAQGLDWSIVGLLILAMLFSLLADAGQLYLLSQISENLVFECRRRLISKILVLDLRVMDRFRAGDLVSRAGSDTMLIRAAFTNGFVDFISSILMLSGAMAVMIYLDWKLFLIVSLIVSLFAFVFIYSSSGIQKYSFAAQTSLGVLSADLERAVLATRTIRSSGAQAVIRRDLEAHASMVRVDGMRTARAEAILSPVANLAVQSIFLAIVGIGVVRVAQGSMSIADLASYIILLFMLINPMGQLANGVMTIRGAMGAFSRIAELLDCEEEESSDISSAKPINLRQVDSVIEFRNVSFGYRPDEFALEGISFEIVKGMKTAIVGPSGSGKSTILSLIEGFYSPQIGEVLFAGSALEELSLRHVRSLISYVEQDAPALAGTVRQNLTLGSSDATDDEICRALDSVNLGQRVGGVEGLEMEIGERGMRLSGGEKQRLAIARALLARAEIFLLDEPTSSVDSVNGAVIREIIDGALGASTVVLVTHQLTSIVNFDRIVVVDKGRVQIQGRHSELMESSRLYKNMFDNQLKNTYASLNRNQTSVSEQVGGRTA